MIENLNNYEKLKPTTKCFTDGRYFNEVFKSYPGLIPAPLNINLVVDKNTGKVSYQTYMNSFELNKEYPGLLRIIINTPNSRHSNLLILDYKNSRVYRFEPYNKKSIYHDYINQIIQEYLGQYMVFTLYDLANPLKELEINKTCNEAGFKSGFCVAYIIKYAYDYLTGQKYNPVNIRKLSTLLEEKYKGLDPRYTDIEYGLFGNDSGTSGVLLGSLGGAAVGGLLTQSPGGVIGGAALGGLLGYGLSR